MRRAGLVVCLAGLTGCPSLGAYQCEQDIDCNRDGLEGRCLADAACAYPENSGRCDSGWARSPNASESPGACIPEEPPPTSGSSGSSTTVDPSDTTTSGGESTSAAETAGPTSPCGTATVTVDTATFSPGAGLEGFVLWVPLTDWPKGATRLASDAYDLQISDASGNTLAYERADLLDGTPALWVALPSFGVEEAVELEFLFGPELSTPAATDVWRTDYLGVWHLDDPPMGLDGDVSRNSAEPSEPGRMYGDMQPDQRVEGMLGPAILFDGRDIADPARDRIEVEAAFRGQLDAYTISLWGRLDTREENSRGSFFQNLNGDRFFPRCWHGSDNSGRLFCQHSVGDMVASTSTEDTLTPGEFLHIALVRDPVAARTTLYVQGEEENGFDDAAGMLNTDAMNFPFEIGHGEWGSLEGVVDEVRVSDHVLSAERLRADYRSQRGGLQFLTFGELLPVACPG